MDNQNPPIIPGELEPPQQPPGWPMIVGVISIIWGGFFLICGGCGLGWYVAMPRFMKMAEEGMKEPAPQIMFPTGLDYAAMLVGLHLSLLALIAGIMTVRRRAAGRTLHLAYAALGILLTVGSVVNGIMRQMEMVQWARQNASSPWARQIDNPTGMIMIVFFTVVGLAYPMFLLYWFGLEKKRPDEGMDDAGTVI